MDRLYKWLLILGLLIISASASIFMTLEAGSFFQTLYSPDVLSPYMGYWAAALAEIFMAVMAGVWLPDIKKNKQEKTHPGNFLFKFLMILLFLATSGGAGLNLLVPVLEKIESQKNNDRVIRLLESQVKDHKNSLDMFVEKKQKLNSIVTIRNQLKTKNELKKFFQNRELVGKLWIEVFFVIFIRFVLQLANLSCIWLAGWVYRRPDNKILEAGKSGETPRSPDLKLRGLSFAAEDGRFEETTRAEKGGEKNVIKLNRDPEFRPQPPPKKSLFLKDLKALSKLFSKTRVKEDSKAKVCREEILNLRKKISGLLRVRNHNVPLAEVCGIIGEKESEIKNIINLKVDMEKEGLPRLENILKKIERLYRSERVESFGY